MDLVFIPGQRDEHVERYTHTQITDNKIMALKVLSI